MSSLHTRCVFQFVLGVCEAVVGDVYKSGADNLTRPVSSGKQTFGTKRPEWPVTEPIPKLSGKLQVCHTTQTKHFPKLCGQLQVLHRTHPKTVRKITKLSVKLPLYH